MLAEAKLEAIHFGVRLAAEQVLGHLKPVKLDYREDANLENAWEASRNQGNHTESASRYYSVYTTSTDTLIRSQALIGLTRGLIDLGSFGQARQFLSQASALCNDFSVETRRRLFIAHIEGQKGWIADYELGYHAEIKHFGNALNGLNVVQRLEWGIPEEELNSTAYHCIGRARVGLADAGVDREENIRLAMEDITMARRLDEKLPMPTINEKVGHGFAWEARCCLRLGEFARADELTEKAELNFRKHHSLFPDSPIMAHYYLLLGERDFKHGFTLEARRDFEEAARIRTGKSAIYPKGVSDAYKGIAATYWKEGDIKNAARFLIKAAKINPQSVARGMLGG